MLRQLFIRLFGSAPLAIDLARVQWTVREERRQALDREQSGKDAAECVARVKRRMQLGDTVWVPPMYGREAAWKAWCRAHRIRATVVQQIPQIPRATAGRAGGGGGQGNG